MQAIPVMVLPQNISIQQPIAIPYTSANIRIDGKLNDWKHHNHLHFADTMLQLHAPPDFPFELEHPDFYPDILLPPKSRNEVDAYLCWDLNYLYVAFEVADAHLFAEIDGQEENPDIYMNDGIEIYLDTGFDSHERMDINDYQFITDIMNNAIVFRGDKDLIKLTDKYAVPKDFGQNILFSHAVTIHGEVNKGDVRSTGYTIELAIPFAAIGMQAESGRMFRIDLCNNDVDYSLHETPPIEGTLYNTRPFNWQGLSNFGFPAYWVEVQLTGSAGWFDQLAYKARQQWLILLGIVFITTIILYSLFLIRLYRLRKIPSKSELPAAAFLVIKGERSSGPVFNENQQILQKATDYILSCRSLMPVSELVAKKMGMSLRKLQRITKSELNCTPTRFIYLVKLNQAADYLLHNKGNVSETAYEFGFSDPSYFSKLFKNHFGESPAEYRTKKAE